MLTLTLGDCSPEDVEFFASLQQRGTPLARAPRRKRKSHKRKSSKSTSSRRRRRSSRHHHRSSRKHRKSPSHSISSSGSTRRSDLRRDSFLEQPRPYRALPLLELGRAANKSGETPEPEQSWPKSSVDIGSVSPPLRRKRVGDYAAGGWRQRILRWRLDLLHESESESH